MTILLFLIATIAFLLFGIATDRHHGRRLRRPCPAGRVRALRAVAWSAVLLDFVLALEIWGSVFGPIGWVGALMIGAAAAFCALNFVPLRKPFIR